MDKPVLIIIGPTAVGKTAISFKLANRLKNVEIISADSRQVYKYMDIGTAKPRKDELEKVNHYFIDIKLPDEYYSAGMYGRDARKKIEQLFESGKTPIVVGGSGLYIRALVDGFFEKRIADAEVRQRLKNELQQHGVTPLYERLQQVDEITAGKIHHNDGQRIVRALEVYELTGKPLSKFQKETSVKADFIPVFVGLNRERKLLYQVVEKRVDLMIKNGLVDEVSKLKEMGFVPPLNSLRTVGYRETFEYLANKIDFSEMVRLIKQRSRNYAKRQLTWFRQDKRIKWFNLDDYEEDRERLVEQVIEIVSAS
ncbi:tRNA (adenosine(37)-N6)-dimethylallyltransferase MiaA [candidate division KSB1 bacterium]|nr:tRNA (adenosine(37)-N6)-dimethylallyltransferase MiaA [candidate division KSB1 bacterium]